jgi:myo-inositol catabolism protein IolH
LRLAIDTGVFALQSWEETFDLIAEAGYGYVEWSQRVGFAFDQVETPELVRVGKLISRAGLKLAGMIPMCRLASPLEEERNTAVESWKRLIGISASLGAPQMFGEMTGNPDFKKEVSLCTNAFKRSLDELAPVLADAGMRASFEPHPGDFIEESNKAVDLIRETGHQEVGYLFCIPHSFVMGSQPAAEMIRYAGKSITHVHIADTHRPTRMIAPPEVRAHEHMIPGWGEVDFVPIFEVLREVGYDGFVSAVVFSHSDAPSRAALEMKEFAVGRLGLRLD